jgi:hypothetical protein
VRAALGGDEQVDFVARLAPRHPRNHTFPGEMLLVLAADAIELRDRATGWCGRSVNRPRRPD